MKPIVMTPTRYTPTMTKSICEKFVLNMGGLSVWESGGKGHNQASDMNVGCGARQHPNSAWK
jgi:hypothetical protein